jgi:hypothetical protein
MLEGETCRSLWPWSLLKRTERPRFIPVTRWWYNRTMVLKIAEHPFRFTGCWELREMMGGTARDEQQLLEAIEEIPFAALF